jgi:NADH dehydrogenase [ubiquinone] 1 alpha subcomplex assembly factor 6
MLLLSAKGYNQLGSVLRNTVRSFSVKPQSSRNNKQSKKDFEYCVDLVQNRDRESYLCGLLMPSSSRQSYFAIRALNVELASIKDGSVSRKVEGAFDDSGGSMALKIRIQWWRQALNQIYGDVPVSTQEAASQDFLASMAHSSWKNPVVRVLDQAVHESNLTRRFLERLLEAREADLDIRQEESMDDAILYAESTFSSLFYLSLETTNVSKGAHPWRNEVGLYPDLM